MWAPSAEGYAALTIFTTQKLCVPPFQVVLVPATAYTPLKKLLAWQARPGTTHNGSGTKTETYSSISATNQHQSRQKIYQWNLQSFFV